MQLSLQRSAARNQQRGTHMCTCMRANIFTECTSLNTTIRCRVRTLYLWQKYTGIKAGYRFSRSETMVHVVCWRRLYGAITARTIYRAQILIDVTGVAFFPFLLALSS